MVLLTGARPQEWDTARLGQLREFVDARTQPDSLPSVTQAHEAGFAAELFAWAALVASPVVTLTLTLTFALLYPYPYPYP